MLIIHFFISVTVAETPKMERFFRIVIIGYILSLSMSSSLAAEVDKKKLIGYDCAHQNLNISTISTSDIANCEFRENTPKITKEDIVLVQLNEFTHTKVIQCKVEITRTAHHCGMFGHTSPVKDGVVSYINEVSNDLCFEMHSKRQIKYKYHVIKDLVVNSSRTETIMLAGELDTQGKDCQGVYFQDSYNQYDDVTVQGEIKITLHEYDARVSMDRNVIYLKSGKHCRFSDNYCMDTENGQTFWQTLPQNKCGYWIDKYSVLFNGIAEKAEEKIKNQTEVVYSFTSKEYTFGLATKGHIAACDTIFTKTEHPKLFIIESSKNENNDFQKIGRSNIHTDNVDIFTYINSKFIYVERHIKKQMQSLYKDILVQRCNLERQVLKNSLSIAHIAPDQFAYDLMKGPGHMALLAGEVVHIIKCLPVSVIVDSEEKQCYAELPVLHVDKRYYLSPRTHILKSKGTLTNCSRVLPSMYYVGDKWIKVAGKIEVMDRKPKNLEPSTTKTWNFDYNKSHGLTGIYTQNDLDNLRDHIMYYLERGVSKNNVFREMDGNVPSNEAVPFLSQLITGEAVEKLLNSPYTSFFNFCKKLGNLSASFIFMCLILYVIKFLLDVAIRTYLLHRIFGVSRKLLGSFWGALTNHFLHSTENVQERMRSRVQRRTQSPRQQPIYLEPL